MSVTELSFAAALQRLEAIRHDLDDVADPDVVESLELEAASLAEHCRSLLRRPRPLRTRQPQAVATEDSVPAAQPFDQYSSDDGAGAPAPPEDPTMSLPTAASPDGEAADKPENAPTESLRRITRRTITLPGDEPSTVEPSSATVDIEDDSPTTALHPPR